MDDSLVVNTFSALAQASLLQVFRLLVRKNSDGLAAGDIAHQLGYHTTLCRHIWLFWPEPDCSGRPTGTLHHLPYRHRRNSPFARPACQRLL